MRLFRDPVVLIASLTAYFFCFGFLYEYAFWDHFSMKKNIFLEEYSAFFIYSFHFFLSIYIENTKALIFIIGVPTLMVSLKKVFPDIKFKLDKKDWITKTVNVGSKVFRIGYTIALFLIIIIIPVNFGSQEAEKMISSLDEGWEVIVLKDGKDVAGGSFRNL